ncbi:hypothetical protein ACVWVY_006893 [Bradyrhizobium sp. URHC0002]
MAGRCVLAKSKRPVPGRKDRSTKREIARKLPRVPSRKSQQVESAASKPAKGLASRERKIDGAAPRTLLDDARKVLERSGWQKAQQEQLSRTCSELVARLGKSCPALSVGRPLKASEVAGEIAIKPEEFHAIFQAAAGAAATPRAVWSDGGNELLVEIAKIALKIEDGLVHVQIPVACEEAGRQTIMVSFATGSAASPAGLIFATDTIPAGPPEIVEIWGEALVSLAWTAVLRAMTALADAAGVDQDGAGLIPAGLEASGSGVKLLVMARHEMDRGGK